MYKCIAVSIFLLLNALNTYSQSNFRKGFIISNTNDTTHGFIDFRADNVNSKLCRFKPELNAPEQVFTPGQIFAYRFVEVGKFYVSKHVTINGIDYDVFLEFLVQGIKNLYFLGFENGYYFFENPDGSMVAITKLDDKIVEQYKIKTDFKYKGQLSYIFRDYMPIATNTKNITFDRKSMIKLTMKYHDKMCDDGRSCVLFENDYKKKYTKFSGMVYTGLEFCSMNVNIVNIPPLYILQPTIGFIGGMSSPRYSKPLWFELDVNLAKFSGGCEYYTSNLDFNKYELSGTKLNYNFGLKYLFELKKINLYLFASRGRTLYVGLKSSYKSTYINNNNQINTSISENAYLPERLNYTTKFGFGAEKKIKTNFIVLGLSLGLSNIYGGYPSLAAAELKLGYRF